MKRETKLAVAIGLIGIATACSNREPLVPKNGLGKTLEVTRDSVPPKLLGFQHSSERSMAGLTVTVPSNANGGVAFYVTVNGEKNSVVSSKKTTGKGQLTGETTKTTDKNGIASIRLSVRDEGSNISISDDVIGEHTLSFTCGGITKTAKINITIPEGWSWETKFRYNLSVNQGKIATTAVSYLGNSPASLAPDIKSSDKWITDWAGGDGERLIKAYKAYKLYRDEKKTNPVIPANPSTARTQILNTLASTFYNANAATNKFLNYDAIVTQLAAIYQISPSPTIPSATDQQAVLTFFGIRAQCKETRDRITKAAIKKQYTYSESPNEKIGKSVRVGMIFNYNNNSHTGVIEDTYFNAKGELIKIKVIESNWGDGTLFFNNPGYQTPWGRTVTRREVTNLKNYSFFDF